MELRAGYKQTDVGLIPDDWLTSTIGDSMRLINGRAFKPTEWKDSGLPIIRIQNLNDPNSEFNYFAGQVDDRHLVQSGTLLFAWSGTKGTSFGARIWTGATGVLNQHIFKVVPNHKKLTQGYSFLVLGKVQEEIEKQAHGFKASFVHVKKSDLVSVLLPIPSTKAEQEAISGALSDADALIESLDKLIAKKRQMKQGAMQELLTGKRRLPGFEGEWMIKRLGDVAEISKGQLITESTAIPGDVPVIAGGKKPAYFHNRANRTGKTITISGSGASAGYVAFYESPIFASDCSTIGEGGNYSVEFIYFVLLLNQEVIYKAQTGGAQPHIHPDDLRPLMIHVPIDYSEQVAIATILSDVDAELVALESRLAKARQIKQGMMHELLTGRIRLI